MIENKTKIMAISDIHGDSSLVRRLARKAKKNDVEIIIMAGDLTFFEISKKNIIGPLLDEKRKILIISGNHDSKETMSYLVEKYSVIDLNESYFKKGNLAIFGAGGSSDIGPYLTEEKEIWNALKNSHDRLEKNKINKKIMVTHTHPFGSKSEFTGIKGSKTVKKAIKTFNPDVLIHGHIHEAAGVEEKIGNTTVFNVARKEKIFEI